LIFLKGKKSRWLFLMSRHLTIERRFAVRRASGRAMWMRQHWSNTSMRTGSSRRGLSLDC